MKQMAGALNILSSFFPIRHLKKTAFNKITNFTGTIEMPSSY